MLTAELVCARRRGNMLVLPPLDALARKRVREIAQALLSASASCVGGTRDDLHLALASVLVEPREQRLRAGLAKLIEDLSTFDTNEKADPTAIRQAVFARASFAREKLSAGERFDRDAVLADVAQSRGVEPGAIEKALFADLRGSHELVALGGPPADTLVDRYERAQAQAVLLRAVQVIVDFECATPAALRAFFRKLKFLRLLYTLTASGSGYRVVVDGPFSLFESVTKYGLKLALLLPALEECDRWRLQADVRWGKERVPLTFRLEGHRTTKRATRFAMPDDVRGLADAFATLGSDWRASMNRDILDLPGVGIIIPDLVFERDQGRDRIYLEVMGYWSRAAVWKRVEIVQAGLRAPILFAVSARLRVSQDVLDEDLPSGLYVYKQTMSAHAVAERLNLLSRNRRG